MMYNSKLGGAIMLRITLLTEDSALPDRYYTSEHGLCLFIEADGKKILFDTGYSDAFIKNASLMGIDLAELDAVAISHGHYDHTWGLWHLIQHYDRRQITTKPLLITHPEALTRKRDGNREIGMVLGEDILNTFFELSLARGSMKITENLLWLGEIPRIIEPPKAFGKRVVSGDEEDDLLSDDTAIAYKGREGLVIITGCSHSGVCNIVEYAMALTGEKEIADIVGGLHLLENDSEKARETGKWLAARSPKAVHACHCTAFQAKKSLMEFVPLKMAGTGTKLEYN